MRTTAQLVAGMLQRLGLSPSESVRTYKGVEYAVSVDLMACLNDAGRQLLTEHPWGWLDDESETVTLLDGVGSYDLPGNVLSLESAGFVGGGSRTVKLVPLQTVRDLRKRTAYSTEPTAFMVALGGGVQRTPGLPAVRTLEVCPEPGTGTPSLTLGVKRGWLDLTEDDPDRVPALPPHFDRALFLGARVKAWRDQKNTPAPDQAEYEAEIGRLMQVDDREQPDMGAIQGDVFPPRSIDADFDPGYSTGTFSVDTST